MTAEDDIIRGQRAAAILADPLVVETFAALEAEYVKRWRDAPSADAREVLWLLLQNLETFRGQFGAYIRQGQAVLAEGDRREKARKQQDAEP
jgi:hypothetical protein